MTEMALSPLRRRMIEDMTVRNFVEKTRNDYIRQVKNLTAFLGRPPDTATAEDLRLYQLHLTEAGVRSPSINAAVSALRFFFSVTLDRPDVTKLLTFVAEPRKIPVVLSPEEVARFLEAAPGPKYKAALSAAYGAGLRVSEVVALKVSDVDSKRMLLRIEQGKGRRDRLAMLSPQLLRRSSLSSCGTGGGSPGPRSGCSPDRTRSTLSPRVSSIGRFTLPLTGPGSPSGSRRTRCATASQLTCWSRTSTSA
jgi:integrase/recombinase XerD